jgi:hypothetical protein
MANIRCMVVLLMSLQMWILPILPNLPHDGAMICVFLKRHLTYKSLYMSKNVHPNMVIVALWDLIETPLYKDLNVTIH